MVEKNLEKQQAITLRKKGLSYREILQRVSVAKSTLSLWLRDVGLAKPQRQRLTLKKISAMRRGWETIHAQKLKRIALIKDEAFREVGMISKRDRWILGTALYWAEGAKEKNGTATLLKFSNSDVAMVTIFRNWLTEFLHIPKDKLKYDLYIHESADWQRSKKWWAGHMNIPSVLIRVYFKRHSPKTHRHNTGKEYHGLLRIEVARSTALTRKVMAWVEKICKQCGIV